MHQWVRVSGGAAVAALLVVMAAAAGADGSGSPRVAPVVGSAFRISGSGATTDEGAPAVAWNDTAGEYLVVWQDGRNLSTRGDDVYGRRVSAAGLPVGDDFLISGTGSTGSWAAPAVAWNGTASEYLVAWLHITQTQIDPWTELFSADLHGRRVSAAGSPVGDEFLISDACAVFFGSLAVAWNGAANEYLVVGSGGTGDICGRRVSAAGSPVEADIVIRGPGVTRYACSPAVTWNATANEYLVVWQEGRNPSTRGPDVYGRRVSASGSPLGSNFRISGPGATAREHTPAVTWSTTANEYLVVWQDGRNLSTRGNDIYGQRVSAAGSPLGHNFRISGRFATAFERQPAVTWNATAGEYLVVWQDGRNSSTRGNDVYGRRVSAAGSPVGHDFRISRPSDTVYRAFGRASPAVTCSSSVNACLVVWVDRDDSATRGDDIYGRRVAG